jgi:hypothetical protein
VRGLVQLVHQQPADLDAAGLHDVELFQIQRIAPEVMVYIAELARDLAESTGQLPGSSVRSGSVSHSTWHTRRSWRPSGPRGRRRGVSEYTVVSVVESPRGTKRTANQDVHTLSDASMANGFKALRNNGHRLLTATASPGSGEVLRSIDQVSAGSSYLVLQGSADGVGKVLYVRTE